MTKPLTIPTPVGDLLCHCGNDTWRPVPDGLIQCTGCGTHYHHPHQTRPARRTTLDEFNSLEFHFDCDEEGDDE